MQDHGFRSESETVIFLFLIIAHLGDNGIQIIMTGKEKQKYSPVWEVFPSSPCHYQTLRTENCVEASVLNITSAFKLLHDLHHREGNRDLLLLRSQPPQILHLSGQ